MSRRIAAAALCFTLAAPLAGAQDLGLTREQFKMYRYWTNALTHPEVQKVPEAKRVKAGGQGRALQAPGPGGGHRRR